MRFSRHLKRRFPYWEPYCLVNPAVRRRARPTTWSTTSMRNSRPRASTIQHGIPGNTGSGYRGAGVAAGTDVADIGAGTGYFAVRLAKSAATPKVYAVDIEPSMVSYLKERAGQERLNNVVAVQAPRNNPNLPENGDIVLIVDTYHHIGAREVISENLQNLLSPAVRWQSSISRRTRLRVRPRSFGSRRNRSGQRCPRQIVLTAQHGFLPGSISWYSRSRGGHLDKPWEWPVGDVPDCARNAYSNFAGATK